MTIASKIAKNTSILLIATIISYLLGFFYAMYTARYLGVEGYGTLSFALTFTGIFAVLTDLGLNVLIPREVSRDKSLSGKFIGNIISIKVILVIIVSSLIALIINLLGYSPQITNVFYLITLSVVFGTFSGIFDSIFQAYEKMEYRSVNLLLNGCLMFAGAMIAIFNGLDVVAFAFIYVLTSFFILLVNLFLCYWKFTIPKIHVDFNFWKELLKESSPLSLAAIFSEIYFRIDAVMLSIIKGIYDVGLYSAPYNLMVVLMFIPSVFTTSIYPVFSKLHISSKESLVLTYKKSFKYLCILGLPIAVGTTFLADKIIMIIYGNAFFGSIIALQILIWTIPLIFLTYMLRFLLISVNRQHILLKIMFFCMCINVIFNLIFIPIYGFIGAALTTVLTEFCLFILCFHYISKFVYKIQIKRYILKPIVASSLMALFIFFFKDMNILLVVIISVIVYISLLILLKTFSKDDINIFRKLIKF